MGDMLSQGSAFPVEPPRQRPAAPGRLGFAAGVAVGVIVAAIAAQVWLAVHLAPVAGTSAAFQPDTIKNLSRLAVDPSWRWGVPAATAVALAILLAARVKRARWYALLAAVAIVAPVLTYEWAVAPWHELASAIR